MVIIKKLEDYKTITLDELERIYKVKEYKELVDFIKKLIEDKRIRIIKASRTNGKSPALYNKYSVVKKKEDNSKYIEELDYKINVKLDTSYYKNNIERYKEDRKYILKLNEFLTLKEEGLKIRISEKERSFQIWQEEKYLMKKGLKLLKKLALNKEYLNYYETNEPLAYYSATKDNPQNILIIENMDTFYTIRRLLMNKSTNILGIEIGTVIYGKGKGIRKSIRDFERVVEKHIAYKENKLLYLGDLDYEGILIYEGLEEEFKKNYNIEPFIEGYIKMIDKAENLNYNLQKSKEKQNKNLNGNFLDYFDEKYRGKIVKLLKSGDYIPQEILNIGDLEDDI